MATRGNKLFAWLKNCFLPRPKKICEVTQARQLIAAIDRGGVPLNTAKVNAIARSLGLEISRKAPVEETIERIRQAIKRSPF